MKIIEKVTLDRFGMDHVVDEQSSTPSGLATSNMALRGMSSTWLSQKCFDNADLVESETFLTCGLSHYSPSIIQIIMNSSNHKPKY